jgi:3-oxoacyl-[acyl-carrier-protein] synthase II
LATAQRVVITGLGTVNPLAGDVRGFWEGLRNGRSGISAIERFDVSEFKVRFGGEVKGFDPERVLEAKAARRMDRFSQFAVAAALEAVADSGVDMADEDPYRWGVALGCGIGGLATFEEGHGRLLSAGPGRISPFVIPRMMPNAAPANVAIDLGLRGPTVAVASACASSGDAVGAAFRAIRWGDADAMLAGGAEAAITPIGLGGFIAARSLSLRNDNPQAASRPFDRDRDGFVLSEGAGIVVLESLEHARRRGANIYAEVMGYGSTNDAYSITAPHPDGDGAARAITLALADARLDPGDVDYINAHATSTPLGDLAEVRAIKRVFGRSASTLPVSSTKSMTGHLCAASGAIELIAITLAVRDGVVPPTINFETPDPACDLDCVPNTARELRVRHALSTSFGFGGHNCCLVVGGTNSDAIHTRP